MLTHRIKLPDGTEIEFFAETDRETFAEIQRELDEMPIPSFAEFMAQKQKRRANKAIKKARKAQKLARRKNR